MSTISIIITSHNQPEYIRRCIRSLEGADLAGYEVIVSDDASTDDTAFVAREELNRLSADRVRVHIAERWGHAGGARNAGAKIASGKYLWLFDGDDTFIPSRLGSLCRFAAESSADCITLDYVTHFRDHDETYHYPTDIGGEFIPQVFVCPWGKLIKHVKYYPFAERCHYQDMDWWYAQADRLDTLESFREAVMTYDRTVEGQSMSAVEYAWKNKRLDGRHGMKPLTIAQWVDHDIPAKDGINPRDLADRYALCARMWHLLYTVKKPDVREALKSAFIRSFGDSICP